MKKLLAFLLFSVMVCVLLIVAYFAFGGTWPYTFTHDKIDRQIAAAFPYSRGGINFNLLNPTTEYLPADNRLTLAGEISVNILGLITAGGPCKISASPQYDPAERAVRFVDLQIENLSFTGIPEKFRDQAHKLANRAVEKFFEDYRLRLFAGDSRRDKFISAHIREVRVADDGLTLVLGR